MAKFNKKKYTDDDGRILLDKFADFLIDEHGICLIDGKMCTYRQQDGIYSYDDDEVEQAIWLYFPGVKSTQRTEIVKAVHLRLKMRNIVKTTRKHNHLIAFRNGIYNVRTREFSPNFSKDYIILNKIDWDYNPAARSKYIDSLLDKTSCFDPEVRALMEEMIGYCMLRSLDYDAAFILVGEKARNGKSTFTRVLKALIGDKNCTGADLRKVCDIKDEYTQAQLYGKLLNIGDDISGQYIPDASTFKSVTTGEAVQARQIYGRPFTFSPYATMVYTTNGMPKIKDFDNGVYRRLKFIRFDYQFDPKAPDFDRDFESKIIDGTDDCSSDESMSYLINLALAGVERLFVNGDFTVSRKCEEELNKYKKDCNPILEWIEEYLEDKISFCGLRREDVYDSYKMWAERTGQKPMSQTSFVRFINDKYDLKVEPKYDPTTRGTVRMFVNKD